MYPKTPLSLLWVEVLGNSEPLERGGAGDKQACLPAWRPLLLGDLRRPGRIEVWQLDHIREVCSQSRP